MDCRCTKQWRKRVVAKVAAHTVAQFWPHYRKRALFIVLGMQLVVLLGITLALQYFQIINLMDPITISIVIGIIFLSLLTTGAVFIFVSQPLHTLASALRYAAGEQSSEQTPSANMEHDPYGLSPLLATIYDIRPEQTADTEVTESEFDNEAAHALAALEHTTTGVALLTSEGRLVYANSSAPTKVDSEGDKQLNLLDDTLQDLTAWLQEQGDTTIRSSKVWQRIPSDLPDNQERRFFDIYAHYTNQSEAPLVLTFIDRTVDYEPEEKDLNFISFAAHELRGPITVIRGYLDTLHAELGGKLESDQEMLFERLTVSSNRLSSYVNNILNAAKYDRRHLKVYLHEDTLANVYASIADDMALRASTQGRLLNVQIPADLPTIAADQASLGEVIGNLIDNAIKYSNEGGTISVVATTSENAVRFDVADQGIGMPANVIENLFTKFYRSHRSREAVSGTGIGLYICKAIVESHGGTIDVRSVEGEGSTFSVTLPTYASIADKLAANKQSNENLIERRSGWIKNHGRIRG